MPDLPFVSRRLHHKHSPPPPPAATARGSRAGEGSRRKQLVVAATPRGGTRRLRCTVGALHVATDRPIDDADAPSDRLSQRTRPPPPQLVEQHDRRLHAAIVTATTTPPSRSDDGSGGGGCRGRGLFVVEPSADEGRSGTAAPEAGAQPRSKRRNEAAPVDAARPGRGRDGLRGARRRRRCACAASPGAGLRLQAQSREPLSVRAPDARRHRPHSSSADIFHSGPLAFTT